MSDARLPRLRPMPRRATRALAVTLLAAMALAAGRVGAQEAMRVPPTAAELRALADSTAAIRARAADARAALAFAEARVREVPDDSLSLSGAQVLFNAADLPAAERARLQRTFARVADRLRLTFGDEGPALLAETRWQLIVTQRLGALERPFVNVVPLSNSRRARPVLRFPLDVGMLEQLVMGEVGERMVARHPQLSTWLGGTIYLTDPATSYFVASRSLAVIGNERSRRCLRGSIEDCAIILDPARQHEWHVDPAEPRTFPPASPSVRASVVHYAVATAGTALLPALEAAPDSTPPVAVLAQAVGVTPEAFLTQWQAAMSDGGKLRAQVDPRLAWTSLAWVALFGFIGTRRRPR